MRESCPYWKFNIIILISRLHAVATHNTEEFIYDKVDSHLQEVGLRDAKARDLVDVVMGYTGKGYAHSIKEELGICLACRHEVHSIFK